MIVMQQSYMFNMFNVHWQLLLW